MIINIDANSYNISFTKDTTYYMFGQYPIDFQKTFLLYTLTHTDIMCDNFNKSKTLSVIFNKRTIYR